jgi:hypothetical protein
MGRSPISGIPDEEYLEDPLAWMEEAAFSLLPLRDFGFKKSYQYFRSYFDAYLIFDSPQCRIRLYWYGWERESGNSMSIVYGRLHAPNEGGSVEIDGKEYDVWHFVDPVLMFLDNFPPQHIYIASHPKIEAFYQKEENMSLKDRRFPIFVLKLHAFIWSEYAPRLFDVFDLRRPDLWEQYRAWLKACYVAEGRKEEEDERKGLIPFYRVY